MKKKEGFFKSIKRRDPAYRNPLQVLLTYPGIKALIYYRIAHFFYCKLKLRLLGEWISYHARKKTGIEIHPSATIGTNLFIDHGMGVVIGETATIGNDVTIYHGVTLGSLKNNDGKRHPTIGNNVMLGANSTILGPVKISDNAKVGANALVITDIKENEIVKATPSGKKVIETLPDKLDK